MQIRSMRLTAEQASRGKAVYDDNCGNCHGTNLDNGEFGPPLRGSAFKMRWASQSANALFTYIATKMPPAAPAGLSNHAYTDVEAYILRANGVAISSSELAPARTQSDITVRTTNQDATYQSVMAARKKLLAFPTNSQRCATAGPCSRGGRHLDVSGHLSCFCYLRAARRLPVRGLA
jgi:cytochrome c